MKKCEILILDLSPVWCQASTWSNAGLLWIKPYRIPSTNFAEILNINTHISNIENALKVSAKCQKMYAHLNVLNANCIGM